MPGVVLYGVGSPLVVDVEASLARAGVSVAAAVQNVEGDVFLLDRHSLCSAEGLSAEAKRLPFLVPLFTPSNRQRAAREAAALGLLAPYSLIDPTVPSLHATEYRGGLYVNSGCSLGAASSFDEFVLINRGACLGHHTTLGGFVSIGPGAVTLGGVKVGRGALIGAGAVVLANLTIGSNSVVGAGSVVTTDVPENCLVVGNPARVHKEIAGYGGSSVD